MIEGLDYRYSFPLRFPLTPITSKINPLRGFESHPLRHQYVTDSICYKLVSAGQNDNNLDSLQWALQRAVIFIIPKKETKVT